MKTDYLIVGAGLTGAVIARCLIDRGRDVVVLDRRSHAGGNVHDHYHSCGVRIHTYGPHYFRTNSESVWAFVNRFGRFYRYEPCVQTIVDGRYEDWPITAEYLRRAAGERWKPAFHGNPHNFEEASLTLMPRTVYEKFVKGYTEKQWGVPARQLAVRLARRFEVRHDGERRLTRHKYQGLPENGYTSWTSSLLAGIPLVLNCDYLRHRGAFPFRRLVYTGPIDELFGFELGRLTYRSQRREHTFLPAAHYVQPCGQVNNPSDEGGPHIRTLEWKHMMPSSDAVTVRGTVLTRETPSSPTEPDAYEYPFPDASNTLLYREYARRAAAVRGLLVCGRLGKYQYYDMDQAIGAALAIAHRLLVDDDRTIQATSRWETCLPSSTG